MYVCNIEIWWYVSFNIIHDTYNICILRISNYVESCNLCHIKNHMNINSYLARAVQRKSFCKFEFSAADDRL